MQKSRDLKVLEAVQNVPSLVPVLGSRHPVPRFGERGGSVVSARLPAGGSSAPQAWSFEARAHVGCFLGFSEGAGQLSWGAGPWPAAENPGCVCAAGLHYVEVRIGFRAGHPAPPLPRPGGPSSCLHSSWASHLSAGLLGSACSYNPQPERGGEPLTLTGEPVESDSKVPGGALW